MPIQMLLFGIVRLLQGNAGLLCLEAGPPCRCCVEGTNWDYIIPVMAMHDLPIAFARLQGLQLLFPKVSNCVTQRESPASDL